MKLRFPEVVVLLVLGVVVALLGELLAVARRETPAERVNGSGAG